LSLPSIFASLTLMKYTIKTIATSARESTALHQRVLRSTSNEDVMILFAANGDHAAAERLYNEAEKVLERAFLNNDGSTEERLDGVLKELNGLIKGLLLTKTITDVQAILAIIDERGMLYISHAGRAEAYVVRSGAANQITEYSKGKPLPNFIHIASGQLEPGDTVMCSTERLLRAVTPANLVAICKDETTVLTELQRILESEQEQACLGMVHVQKTFSSSIIDPGITPVQQQKSAAVQHTVETASETAPQTTTETTVVEDVWSKIKSITNQGSTNTVRRSRTGWQKIRSGLVAIVQRIKGNGPIEGKKLHLLLLAGVIALFLIIWLIVNISTFAQTRQIKAELTTTLEEVQQDLRNAENRRLTGDTVSATAILERAEERLKTVLNDPSRLFITEATDLLQNVQSKREEVSNILRRSPIVAANVADKKDAIQTVGLIGNGGESFIVYDKQDAYRIISSTIEDAVRVSESDLLTKGANFERFDASVFITDSNTVIETANGVSTAMKTDDEKGWATGVDIETFNRNLYILSPEKNQIFKYERLTNRYGFPVEYNVNGALSDALDMTIDFFVYVLKADGTIIKLSSGENSPFSIKQAPDGLLKGVTKIYKVPNGKLYALDPVQKRVIVIEIDKNSGDATYLRQFILESDQMTEVNDFYVDPDESWLYVLDEKRLYKLELSLLR
jgi:hypothetical protein